MRKPKDIYESQPQITHSKNYASNGYHHDIIMTAQDFAKYYPAQDEAQMKTVSMANA